MRSRFALRVDVDTVSGLTGGTPRVIELCEEHGVRVTFFVCVGRDTASRAFLWGPRGRRHLAINPLRKYGLREILFSLPGRSFSSHAERIRGLERAGHEVELHCLNHLRWIRRIENSSPAEAEAMLLGATKAFEAIMDRKPTGFASPGFRVSEASLDAEDHLGFSYASDFMRDGDCIPFRTAGREVLQIPVNAPLVEDLVAGGATDDAILDRLLGMVRANSLTVLYVHACYEPRLKHELLSTFLESAREWADPVTLGEVYRDWSP